MDEPEFARLNGRKKIPVFEEDGLVIGESGAILLHLAERHRDPVALSPAADAPERGLFFDLCFFALTEMDAILYRLRMHEGLAVIYGASENACTAAREYFLRSAGEIERRLADGRPHLLGESFSAADVVVTTCLDWARFVAIELPDPLESYRERIAAREAYGRAMAVNFPPKAFAALRDGAPPAAAG